MMPIPRQTDNRWKFTKAELETILNKMILGLLDGIVNYKCHQHFDIRNIHSVTDVQKQTPLAFQQRFFLLMDILSPGSDYARMFIKREHPDMLYLFNWLYKLYVDEAEITSSTKGNNGVE